MSDKKSERRDYLLKSKKSAMEGLSEAIREAAYAYAEGYKSYLDNGKTERDCVAETIYQAGDHGYERFAPGMEFQSGDKIYAENHGKSIMLVRAGKKPLNAGVRMMVAHIDAPRIDLKPNPLYEQDGFAMFKTHYYGGIKKYQWMAIPLELRGVVFRGDGSSVEIAIGDDADEPVLFISDLLPHLSADQYKKTVPNAFPGENLNVTVGTIPDAEEGEERVKLAIMDLLNSKFGIVERDFASAELCLVPAGHARDTGLDSSLIGAYGHDDRSCSYAGLRALFDCAEPEYTSVVILADKEEIGSEGITGIRSAFYDYVLDSLCRAQGGDLQTCYQNSFCLSGDVCNALDPNFAEVSDSRNNARLCQGPGVFKATGRGGKSGASDASAITVSRLRTLLDNAQVPWQIGELGKVDQGGGGTVALHLAARGIEVIDIGVPVLNMHAPFEVCSKMDCYWLYKAFVAHFEN